MDSKKCLQCNKEFQKKKRFNLKWWKSAKYCSIGCSHESRIGKVGYWSGKQMHNKGKPMSLEQKIKISLSKKGVKILNKRKGYSVFWDELRKENFRKKMGGENNPRWIADRSKIKVGERLLNDPLQKGWRKGVKDRDGWKCKINNPDCKGRLEAHHILTWKEYPELRYEINNGITLCHFHHPRKQADVKKLSPYFQRLVAKV